MVQKEQFTSLDELDSQLNNEQVPSETPRHARHALSSFPGKYHTAFGMHINLLHLFFFLSFLPSFPPSFL